jgi:hypothetical protein
MYKNVTLVQSSGALEGKKPPTTNGSEFFFNCQLPILISIGMNTLSMLLILKASDDKNQDR